MPSDNFQVSIAPNFEHYECTFTVHLPVGKRVDLKIWKLKNETSEIIKASWIKVKVFLSINNLSHLLG